MKETDDDMASMIVAEFPQATAALAVTQALHRHLPIKSSKHLVEVLEDQPAEVMGVRITGKMIAGLVPDDLWLLPKPPSSSLGLDCQPKFHWRR